MIRTTRRNQTEYLRILNAMTMLRNTLFWKRLIKFDIILLCFAPHMNPVGQSQFWSPLVDKQFNLCSSLDYLAAGMPFGI